MAIYVCEVCGFKYDEDREGVLFEDLDEDWSCPVCGSSKKLYQSAESATPAPTDTTQSVFAYDDFVRTNDALERHMDDIHRMAESGESIIEPMRTTIPTFTWDEILIKGSQIAQLPVSEHEAVAVQTVIGPHAPKPLVIETPLFVTHMSFGALSKEAKIALARGSAAAQTATCSGEGGILPESLESSYRYIFEYVPNQYSVTDEYLQKVDAIEIKLGQSAKPGMGGHLPGVKVTKEIADIRGFPEGSDIISPPFFSDIKSLDELRQTVDNLRQRSGGRPVGVKIAAGHIEDDLEIIALADPDFITIDGRAGGTGAAPKFVKASASIPTIFALHRARACLDKIGKTDVQLIITGGLRISPDFAKALAMGADAIALGTSALMALGCQQYRQCHLGTCPMGITSQDPDLRRRLDIDGAAQKLARFLSTSTEELKTFARLTGKRNIHDLSVTDICTTNSEISGHTAIEHV